MKDKQSTPTQNVQRVKMELRSEDPSIRVIMRSMVTQEARKELTAQKEPNPRKQELLEAPAQPPTHLQTEEEVETLLRTCLKLLRNPQARENLQVLLQGCAAQPNTTAEVKEVHKLHS